MLLDCGSQLVVGILTLRKVVGIGTDGYESCACDGVRELCCVLWHHCGPNQVKGIK